MATFTRSRAILLFTFALLALTVFTLVSAHKGGHSRVPKDAVHTKVDSSKKGECPFHVASKMNAPERKEEEQQFHAQPVYDEDGNLAGSPVEHEDEDKDKDNINYDDYDDNDDNDDHDEVKEKSRMKSVFAFLFPGSPMVNSLLGTTYISLIPNLLLYFVPPDIKPESLNTLVAFAVGGLLGDVFLHLLPHSFMGDVETNEVVIANEKKNIAVGLAIFIGFFVFFCIDKVMRVLSGGEGGHSHSHGHDHGKKVDGENEGHQHHHHHEHENESKESTLRMRKGNKDQDTSKDDDDNNSKDDKTATKEISNSIKLSAYLNLIADATHNFTDGLAMAASFYTSPAIGATTTVAVFFHEIPHEVGDYAILIQSGFPRSKAMLSQFVTAIGAFLGTFAGIAIEEMSKAAVESNPIDGVYEEKPLALFGIQSIPMRAGDLVIPFTAGGFLYIATVGVIPELLVVTGKLAKDARQFASEIVAMMIGVGMMTVIAWNE